MNELEPQQLAVKYHPPKICLIYNLQGECYFHEMAIKEGDLTQSAQQLFNQLETNHPGYLDKVDIGQVCKLLELIKSNAGQPKPKRRSFEDFDLPKSKHALFNDSDESF